MALAAEVRDLIVHLLEGAWHGGSLMMGHYTDLWSDLGPFLHGCIRDWSDP